ncbi:hypothetical protein JXA32_16570 [Candidatus Sumerlaeota bacterium]|nr:hypothetical protein [Candidatus Sumerlaeota bacterium]
MADYIPAADAEFNLWQGQFNTFIQTNGATLGFDEAELLALQNGSQTWDAAYDSHLAAQTAARAATEGKDNSREGYEPLLRQYSQRCQSNPAMTDAMREEAGLPVYSGTRTRAGVPTSRPVLVIDSGERLAHTIRFADTATPNSRKKPDGVAGIQLYVFVGGDAPPDVNAMQYVAYDSATPYMYQFETADAGKNAWWAARWVNSRQEPGPWSETVMATIAG